MQISMNGSKSLALWRRAAGTSLLVWTALLIGCTSDERGKLEAKGSTEQIIKIGALATLTGPLTALGEDGMRGVELAIDEVGGKVAGKKIVLVKESSDATPNVALNAARKLIEQEKVDFMIGPLSGDEGLAVRDFAKTHPERAFMNGSSGAQDTTLRDPAPNFYRFSTEGVQWMAGLGSYVFKEKGYKRVATLAEDYSFPYAQVGGFITDFCRAGGHVPKKLWVPLGTTDFSSVISSLPKDIDAIYVALGGADAVNFLKQYDQFGGKAPLIGGTIMVDQTILSTKGTLSTRLIGTVSQGPIADGNPDEAWQAFTKAYQTKFPKGLPSPSLSCHGYYLNTKAALLALQSINGDLSNNQAKFKEALNNLQFKSPTGTVKIDKNRNGIGNMFLSVVDKKEDGTLFNRLVKVTPDVDQTLGIPEAEFLKAGSFNRDNPDCP
jgi:branched-chain amino acid transport system substrate-binding protein